ncbi:MAG: hypothetical protein ACK5CE_14440 [Actinomycetes bacterium]
MYGDDAIDACNALLCSLDEFVPSPRVHLDGRAVEFAFESPPVEYERLGRATFPQGRDRRLEFGLQPGPGLALARMLALPVPSQVEVFVAHIQEPEEAAPLLDPASDGNRQTTV